MAGLNFDITANGKQFQQALEQANRAFRDLQRYAQTSGQSVDSVLHDLSNTATTANGAVHGLEGSLKGVAAELFSIAGISWGAMAFVKQMVQVRSEMQNTEASLKVFLGSAEKASKFMEELSDAAYWNVFEFKDLAAGASQMLAYGNAADEVIPMLQRMSEIASGTGKDLASIVQIYDKVKSMDKIDSMTRLSLKNMGIDVVHEIAQIQGVADSAINSASLGFKELQEAIKAVTDEGGMYFGMMQAKMDNVSDKIGTLQDAVTTMFNEMGKLTEGVLKEGIDVIIKIVENWQTLVAVIETVVGVYGTYKTTMLVITAIDKTALAIQSAKVALTTKEAAAERLNVFWKNAQAKILPKIAAFLKMENAQRIISIKRINAEIKAQKALNIAKMAGSGLAILAGIAGTVWAATATKNMEVESAEEKAINRVNDQLAKQLGAKKDIIDNAHEYISTLRQETTETNAAADALERLRQLDGFENITFAEFKKLDMEGKVEELINAATGKEMQNAAEEVLKKNISTFNRRIQKELTQVNADGRIQILENPIEGLMTAAKVEEEFGKKTKALFKDMENAANKMAEAMYQSISGLEINEQKNQLKEWIATVQEANKALANNSAEYAANAAQINIWRHNLQALENQFPTVGNVPIAIAQAVRIISENTDKIRRIQSGQDLVVDPEAEINKLESAISTAKKTFKTLTGAEYSGSSFLTQFIQDFETASEKVAEIDEQIKKAKDELIFGTKEGVVNPLTGEKSKESNVARQLTEEERKNREELIEKLEEERKLYQDTLGKTSIDLLNAVDGKNLSNEEIRKSIENDRKRSEELAKKLTTTNDPALEQEKKEVDIRIKQFTILYQNRLGLSQQEYQAQQARKKALREERQLETDRIQAERIRLERSMQDQLELLDIERREYQISHGGEDLPAYELRRQNIIAKTTLSLEKLDLQARQTAEDFEMAMRKSSADEDIRILERRISLENDYGKKLELEAEYRERVIQSIKDVAADNLVKDLRNYSEDVLSAYREFSQITDDNERVSYLSQAAAKFGIGVTPEQVEKQFQDIEQVVERSNRQVNADIAKRNQEFADEDEQRLLDMLNSYLGYETKRLQISTKYDAMLRLAKKQYTDEDGFFLSKDAEQAYTDFVDALKRFKSTEMQGLVNSIREELFDSGSVFSKNYEMKSISNVRKVVRRIQDAIRNGKQEDVSFIADELGLTEQQVNDMIGQGEKLNPLLQEILDNAKETSVILSGNLTQDITAFFKTFRDRAKKDGVPTAEAFGTAIREMFDEDNLGGMLQGVGESLSQLSAMLDQFAEASDNPKLSTAAEVIGGIAQNFSSAGMGAATGGWVGAVVAGVIDAVGQSMTAITEAVSGTEVALLNVKSLSLELKKLRYEADLSNNGDTIFGDNARGNLVAALGIIKEFDNQIFKTLSELANNDVLSGGTNRGMENFVEDLKKYGNVGIKVLKSLQVQTKKYGSDRYKSLYEIAPEIWNQDGSINTDALDSFINVYGDKLTSSQKLLLESLAEDVKAYNEAIEQAMSYYSSLFGNIGDDIIDSFVTSFKDGEDALDSFTQSLDDSLEQWIKDFARMAYIQPVLQQMEDMVKDALSKGGDADVAIENAISLLYDSWGEMRENTEQLFKNAKEKFDSKYGTTLFEDDDEVKADKGGFQSMSQDTTDELNARFTALQIEGANVVAATNTMLEILSLMQGDSERRTNLMQSIATYQELAYQQAEERLDIIKAIRDNTDIIVLNTNRLRAIETNTNKL